MKALVKHARGKGNIEIRDVPEPVPADDEVLIEVKAASVCGSDLHIYHDEHPYWPPVTLGHEFSGVIATTGGKVQGWKPGQKVVSETRTGTCGRCRFCLSGAPQVCPEKRALGIGRNGAFTRFVTTPAALLHSLPDHISFDVAAMMEPLAICTTALIETVGIRAGDVVLILGPGPIGLFSLLLARLAGASEVIVAGREMDVPLKLTMAKSLGADVVVNVDREDPVRAAMSVSAGQGADVVVESSGAPPAIAQACRAVRRQGRIAALGITAAREVSLPWNDNVFRAFTLQYCFSSSWTAWEAALRLLAKGKLAPEPLVTHRLPLDKWEELFAEMEKGKVIKAILYPS